MNLYDIVYGLGLGISAPYWLVNPRARQKVMGALRQRMGDVATREPGRPAVMIHAVSLGEINATRALVKTLSEARGDLQFIISTTTQTGFARGRELYGSDPNVILMRYPLDFSRAVRSVLDRVRPSVVALMELEVWPNFVRHCVQRKIAVVVINGRLTARSFGNYRWGGGLVRKTFGRLSAVCVQDEVYAQRFIELGAVPQRVQVTGTMKFDTAEVAQGVEGDEQLAAEVGLCPGSEKIWVCGSTGPGEEEIALRVYRQLLGSYSGLRLVIVPRKPERFDEVAAMIEGAGLALLRRSGGGIEDAEAKRGRAVVLGDTMGELRKFYSLADVVFVGRTLVDLGQRQHGSDMIEPAALGKAVIVGPYTTNFADAMRQFHSAKAMIEVSDENELFRAVWGCLSGAESAAMGRRAQDVVRAQQGATARHARVILEQLSTRNLVGTANATC